MAKIVRFKNGKYGDPMSAIKRICDLVTTTDICEWTFEMKKEITDLAIRAVRELEGKC
jgi:hypothetical protein